METKYYLPLRSQCLAHYLGHASILPSRYLPNKPPDIQNKFEDYLLISSNIWTKGTDCCLELVITESEKSNMVTISPDYFIYTKPLPITRIRYILFPNQDQCDETLVNIVMSTAFVPDKLIKIVERTVEKDIIDYKITQSIQKTDYSTNVKKFNSLLGGFALMRLSGEDYMNYSEHYFSTLSFFNDVIKSELEVSGKKVDDRFFDSFIGKGSFKKLFPLLNKVIDENDLNKIAKDENQHINKDKITRAIDLNSLEKGTYIIAVLSTYGVGEESKKKKIDGLILTNFKSEIKPDKSEVISLCYGLNRGYAVFSNKYRSGGSEKIVKFQLNSQLDYYTIESLYQYCYYGITSEGFPYLDSWCSRIAVPGIKMRKTDFQILDTIVHGKKKPKVYSEEYLGGILQKFFQKDSEILFKALIEKLRSTIYNDVTEELMEESSVKDEQILSLKKTVESFEKLEAELDRLRKENETIKSNRKNEVKTYEVPKPLKSIVEDPKILIANSINKEQVVQDVYDYQELTSANLKKKALEYGIDVKGLKGHEIIKKLISMQGNTLFDNQ